MAYTKSDTVPDSAMLSFDSMEGIYESPVRMGKAAPPAAARPLAEKWLVMGVAAAAYAMHYLPFAPFQIATAHGVRRPLSAAILAILIGLCVRGWGWVTPEAVLRCRALVKRLVPVLIVLTGAGLNLTQAGSIGGRALLVTVACIGVGFGAAVLFGRVFGARGKLPVLIGAGTAICGTSAIIASAPVVGAEDDDVALAASAVSLLGLVLMVAMPLAGALLQMPQAAFGVWAGTSIQAVPQVVAAAFAYGEQAGVLGTLVKLVRVTLLAPFLILLVLYSASGGRQYQVRMSKLIPSFLWGFLALAVLATLQLLPTLQFQLAPWVPAGVRRFDVPMAGVLVDAGNILLTIVMAAMGLEASLRGMLAAGRPALLTGLAACVALLVCSLALIQGFL